MNPFLKMEINIDRFSKNDHKIYETIINDPEVVPRNSIVDFAKLCKVSQPSVTRFCQKLGYDKYADFKYAIYSYAKIKTNSEESNENYNLPAIENYVRLLNELDETLNKSRLLEIGRYVMKAKHIFITGIQQSFLPAQLLEINLRKLGFYAVAITQDSINEIKQIAKEDDLIIVFSVRANRGVLENIYESHDTKCQAKLLLVTMTDTTKYKNNVDYMVVLPPAISKDYSLRLESQVEYFIFVDLLTSHIALLLDKEHQE